MINLYFLGASEALTKTFTLQKDGTLEKTQYPPVKNFTSYHETANDIGELYKHVVSHSALGHCLLKGTLLKPLNNESRAGSTYSESPSKWLMFDADKIQNVADAEAAMKEFGLPDVSYVVQLSASSGMDPTNTDFSAHIFVELDKEYPAPVLKNFLTYLNFSKPILSSQVRITKSNVALSYPLDITVAQSDKLLFIAPPICVGFNDPIPKRIHLVKKSTDVFSLPADTPPVAAVEKMRRNRINELRVDEGLAAKRSWVMKDEMGQKYIPGATPCTVTGIKEERGFVYLNVNGGNSWAYYHSVNNPAILGSFKGDGPLLTKEFIPDYYKEVSKAIEGVPVKDWIYLAYRDFKTAGYYNLAYNTITHELRMARATSLTQLEHFMEQYDAPYNGTPTDWEHVYEPHISGEFKRIDTDRRTINVYNPPEAAKYDDPLKKAVIPPSIWEVLDHVVGHHAEFLSVMINNWAYQLQTGKPIHTALVFHGVQGTGKGLIISEILPVVFGKHNVIQKTGKELSEAYNGYMENAQIVVYNEADAAMHKNAAGVDSTIKAHITDDIITIREMYKPSYEIQKKCSLVFASNKSTPVKIEYSDRRFNIGEFQTKPLIKTAEQVDEIREDAVEFRNYLLQYKYDPALIRYIVKTSAREELMHVSAVGAQEFVRIFIEQGNFRFLMEQLPIHIPMDIPLSNGNRVPVKTYAYVIYKLLEGMTSQKCEIKISREDLITLWKFNFSTVPDEPYKFATYVKHYRVSLKNIRIGSDVVRGITVKIDMNDEDWLYCNEVFSARLQVFKSVDAI